MAQDAAQSEDLARQLESISEDVGLAVEELRSLAHGINPPVLTDHGLVSAIRALAIRAPIAVVVVDEGIGRLSAHVEAAVYFCALEAVQNAIKHAGTDACVTVVLRPGPRRGIGFEVTDDGTGMNTPPGSAGIGLISMRDRIGEVGGEPEVVSSPGAGTSVRGTVPDDRLSYQGEAIGCSGPRVRMRLRDLSTASQAARLPSV
jgi:signal transduction histidine kinase